jgi:hypothetical protein
MEGPSLLTLKVIMGTVAASSLCVKTQRLRSVRWGRRHLGRTLLRKLSDTLVDV